MPLLFYLNFYKKLLNDDNQLYVPKNISLIKFNNDSLSWNHGCNNLGQNCRKIFTYFDSFKTLDFNEIENLKHKDKNNFFDLIYLENTLDHINDFSLLLNKFTEISKNIVLITHGVNSGAQHLFFLNYEFLQEYCKLKNLKLTNITEEIEGKKNLKDDSQCHLLTRIN